MSLWWLKNDKHPYNPIGEQICVLIVFRWELLNWVTDNIFKKKNLKFFWTLTSIKLFATAFKKILVVKVFPVSFLVHTNLIW